MLGSWEIILIIFFVMILFGPNKIPEIFNNLKEINISEDLMKRSLNEGLASNSILFILKVISVLI